MFGSSVLEVVVGLLAVYLLMGAITAALTAVISSLVGERSLRLALIETLGRHLADSLRKAPLYVGRPLARIPASVFTVVLMEKMGVDPKTGAPRLDAALLSEAVRSVLVAAQGNSGRIKAGLEALVLSIKFRAAHSSRRLALGVAFALALLFTVAIDIDTLALGTAFWQDQAVRAAVTGAAQSSSGTGLEDAFNAISQYDIPAGWLEPPQTQSGWVLKVIGLLLTTLSVWVIAVIGARGFARLPAIAQDGTNVVSRIEAERWEALLESSPIQKEAPSE
jgi:hypothetical protein